MPSLCEGMSIRETLVGEADGYGDIMGEFSIVFKKFLSSVCRVAPRLRSTC